ncbi:peroxiredoxin [Teratosphaeria destructans]|uniref:Peroxiredoxin n=1 Tax=Teratosphaeria destructans TaxID=418781 RepID=A0A9W7SRS4_9PEZI|nr:peroxiredoxin [Teratosphaeria destructans]
MYRFAIRQAQPLVARRSHLSFARAFHGSPRCFVEVGDAVPDIELREGSPGNKVSIAKEAAKGKGLIIGVPAAFSPSCSETHVPGYINFRDLKNAGKVFVVAVNDPFVTKAWAATLDPEGKSGVRFLADPHAEFTKALDLDFDATAIFGQPRSKRYVLVIENGKVKEAHVEPDNTGVNVSAVEKVLGGK